jgi:predicted DNA-binding transcriptional regulator AlpA
LALETVHGPVILTVKSYLTPIQVSVRTGITKAALAKWRRDGRGPVFVKHGRRIEYPSSELEAWLQAQRRE